MSEARQLLDIQRRLDHLEALSQIENTFGIYGPTYLGLTTPGVTTYSIVTGTWTRTGNRIFVTGRVAWTAATGTGIAIVSLPYAGVFTRTTRFPVVVYTPGVTFANGSIQAVLDSATAGGAAFVMLSPLTNAAGTLVAVEAAGDISFDISYEIA